MCRWHKTGRSDRYIRQLCQKDLKRLEKWADRHLIKFNKGKCKDLHLGKNSPRHHSDQAQSLSEHHSDQAQSLSEQLESSFAKNLLDTKISISQQSAPAAKLTGYPGLHWQECCQETKGGDPASVISSGEASPAVLWPGLGSQYTRCMNTLQSPEKGQEDDYRADERRGRDLGWLSLEKAWGELINVHKYPNGLQRGQSQDQRQRAQSEKSGNTFPLWGWLSTGRSCPDRL